MPQRYYAPQRSARLRRARSCPSARSGSTCPEPLDRAPRHEQSLPRSAPHERRQRPACCQLPSAISASRIDGAGLLRRPASTARDSCGTSSRSTARSCLARREGWRHRASGSRQNGLRSNRATSCCSRSPANASATWPSTPATGGSSTRRRADVACAMTRSTRSADDGSRGGSSRRAASFETGTSGHRGLGREPSTADEASSASMASLPSPDVPSPDVPVVPSPQSALNATLGSTRAARRAGARLATIATTSRMPITPA